MSHKQEHELPVDQLYFTDDYNPNVQDDATFNALVEQIAEVGITENIVVVDHSDNPDWQHPETPYEVVSGNHRGKAAQVLGLETIPARIWSWQEWDADFVKFQNVRHNVLKGKLSPEKFTKLFQSLASKYGEQATRDMMMFVDQEAFKKTILTAAKDLPPEMRKELEKAKDDIKTVDDLSNILNKLFSEYGDTLRYDFMVFDYGGRQHYWIRMDKELKDRMGELRSQILAQRVSMNELFKQLVVQHAKDIIHDLPSVDRPDVGDLTDIQFETV